MGGFNEWQYAILNTQAYVENNSYVLIDGTKMAVFRHFLFDEPKTL
ncbi:hypothetical protein [Lacticaseibacillus rhamnosus]|nr:hypothetical protein [Lacticaseibacillus rhamnosus]